MTLIDHILERPNKEGLKFEGMAEIVKKFVVDVFGTGPDAPVVEAPVASSNIVEYDAAGSAIDVAKMVLIDKGVEVGTNYYSPKAIGLEASRVWKLINVDGDGVVTLQPYSNIGELLVDKNTEIPGANFSAMYSPFDKQFKTIVAYPSNEAKHNKDLIDSVLVNRVKECLITLAMTMADQPLIVRTSPVRGVVSKSEIGVGKLRLSPVTTAVLPFNAKKKKDTRQDPRQQCTLTLPDKTSTVLYSMGSPPIDEKYCNAYFAVATTHDEQLANMVIQTENVPFILASCSKLKIAGNEHIVSIPILVNKSIIKEGEELFLFEEKPVIEKKPAVVQGLEFRPSKKTRVA